MRSNGLNSPRDGIAGRVARDSVNDENWGGVVDGNTQLPIFSGDVVDINNSPDIVRPKLSWKIISSAEINGTATELTDMPVKSLMVRLVSDFIIMSFATLIELVIVARSVIIRPVVV